ncbi:50S ribosomal protein L32 [Candidatus Woesebacteria bacterium]|nr:50S ribosomal protein L32 [Candidatus Woesebacteria bacterium]MBP9687539.1 50S ribosomal protein L32 [Candidatus Woesebacteria bacterium]
MAPVPKKKHSHQRSAQRRGAISMTLPTLSICKNCGKKKLPHTACAACGAK